MKRISCDAHDYFEIICMRHSNVIITTINDQKYDGVAKNIKLNNGQEVLSLQKNEKIESINLTDIKKLEAVDNKIAQHNFIVEW